MRTNEQTGTNHFDHLYCFSKGSYSDYRETWYAHERVMTQLEVFELLRSAWPEVKANLLRLRAEREREFEQLFGVPEASLKSWQYLWAFEGQSRIMKTPKGTLAEADAFSSKWYQVDPTGWAGLLTACGFVEVKIPFIIEEDDYGVGPEAVDMTLARGPVLEER